MNEPAPSRTRDFAELLRRIIREQFALGDDQAAHDVIDERIRNGVPLRGTNLWVLVFAILVASIGLNINSTAVIIGAMLISPLMGPIMGLGYGVAINDFDLIKEALRSLGLAILISLIASTAYFKLSPLSEAGSELLSRTSPSIWDVLIALFGGLAGIIGATRAEKSNVLPGVAIATALMPPLCTAGYGIATGHLYYFLGAFYLFFINSVFIAFSTILMVTLINPPHRQFVDAHVERRVRRSVLALVVVTVLPSIYLAVQLVSVEVFRSHAAAFVRKEINGPGLHVADLQVSPAGREIEVTLIGDAVTPVQVAEFERRMADFGLTGARLTIHQAGDQSIDLTSLKASLLNDLYKGSLADIQAKDKQIAELQKNLQVARAAQDDQQAIAHELLAQYPFVESAAIAAVAEWSEAAAPRDTVLVVKLGTHKHLSAADRARIAQWLDARTGLPVRIFEDTAATAKEPGSTPAKRQTPRE